MIFHKKDDTVFDKINNHLTKKGHQMVLSMYLSNYSECSIYVRFDFIPELSVYKVVWVDLNFFDEKKMDLYISQQLTTDYCAKKIIDKMRNIKIEPGFVLAKDIIGDRVEILSFIDGEYKEFVFDRFIPLEWEELIEPIALLFSYLPRGMEGFLNEMLALFDGKESFYIMRKPIKFDLKKGDLDFLFDEKVIRRAEKYVDGGRVSFLEKIDSVYIGIVDDFTPFLVVIEELDNGFIVIKSNCNCADFCKHICALIIAIRKKKFNNFYKVRYIGSDDKSLLDKITDSSYNLCFGIDDDKFLIITRELEIYKAKIVQNKKCVFEIIEDDDECNLTKNVEKLLKK